MPERVDWIVLKFGGSSVSSRARWETIAEQIESLIADGKRPVVVCSAVSGISDRLEALIESAPRGEFEPVLASIRQRHLELGEQLEVDASVLLEEELELMERLSLGASLTGEVSPGLHARIMALGELMSTRLGTAFLRRRGVDVGWCDARELLTSKRREHEPVRRRFLSAVCPFDEDEGLQEKLGDRGEAALLTQGFIASDEKGRTVLLGRGGSDTSAAYLAAKLGAGRLEIWTDVPGMFTANPRQIRRARLLRRLDYQEAQELATMGATVLHPRCIPPVRQQGIELVVRCTPHPQWEGTRVAHIDDEQARVKAISAKKGITAISMDTLGMWQQVGFLADVFVIFKRHGLSIDLVATSESNVTVTLDPMANALEPEVMDRLISDLDEVCTARVVDGCAVVSLVGRKIRSILSGLAPALQVFEEHQIHLMSQAASDLNMSLVVDEGQADRLVQKLHELLFGEQLEDAVFGPRWNALVGEEKSEWSGHMWWHDRASQLCDIAAKQGATFVYDGATLDARADELMALKAVNRVFYAMKANPHPEILRRFASRGLGVECVSPGELERVDDVFEDLEGERILFTPNFAARQEYEAGFESGGWVTLDNLYPLENWPDVFAGRQVLVRIDPGQGRGHHRYVRTAGPRSKFGVSPAELEKLARLAEEIEMEVVGLHAHVGSGVREPGTWSDTAVFLESCRRYFDGVRILNLGGGIGVPERPGQHPLDLQAVDRALCEFKEAHPDLELWLEPGRFLVSEAGVLLARVTQRKDKPNMRYVGVETGMNSLIRPALYGAYHGIVNLSRIDEEPTDFFEVVGPICESGDVLGHARRLAEPAEGDVLLVANAGAYGRAMSSEYNLREPAGEVVLE